MVILANLNRKEMVMKKSIILLIVAITILITVYVNKDEKVTHMSGNAYLVSYMTFVKEQSDIIKNSLEYDVLTQTDMNMKSQELYELWNETLNYLWDELRNSLSEEEFVKLQDAQWTWSEEKEKTLEDIGKEVKGGSLYSLVVNMEAARIIEERVYELYKLLNGT